MFLLLLPPGQYGKILSQNKWEEAWEHMVPMRHLQNAEGGFLSPFHVWGCVRCAYASGAPSPRLMLGIIYNPFSISVSEAGSLNQTQNFRCSYQLASLSFGFHLCICWVWESKLAALRFAWPAPNTAISSAPRKPSSSSSFFFFLYEWNANKLWTSRGNNTGKCRQPQCDEPHTRTSTSHLGKHVKGSQTGQHIPCNTVY